MAYPSLTYRGTSTLTTDTAVYNFNGCAIGNPSELRAVLVFIQFSSLDNSWPNNTNPASLTINGVEATKLASLTVFHNAHIAAFIAYVPAGTTCDISATYNLIGTRCSIVWYTLKPSSLTPVDVVTLAGQNVSSDNLLDIATVNNGVVVICWTQSASGAQTLSWTGPDAVNTDLALTAIDTTGYWVQAVNIKPTETLTTRDFLMSSATMRRQVIAVSFAVEGTSFDASVSDSIDTSDAADKTVLLIPEMTEGTQFFDIPRHTPIVQLTDTLTDGMGMGEVASAPYLDYIDEFVWVEDFTTLGSLIVASDVIMVSELPSATMGYQLVDAIEHSDSVEYRWVLLPVITEQVGMRPVVGRALRASVTVSENGRVMEAMSAGIPRTLVEGIGVSNVLTASLAMRLVEQLQLVATQSPQTTYRKLMLEGARLTDTALKFLGGYAVDTVAITDTLVRTPRLAREAVDGIGVADVTVQTLVLRVTAEDDVQLTHTQVIKMLFEPVIAEGIDLSAAYISPNGNITTWAINTKNMAATEYTNYAFNSFAQMGHKYLGATDNGLYELTGDDDAGANIIAHLKSGIMQLGGSRFTSFKSAYVGQRGTGEYVLKIETGDGKTYNYKVVGKDMQTSRVHFGKGLRARYFAFELISTGQDFDLDTVEFIPLVAQRRV